MLEIEPVALADGEAMQILIPGVSPLAGSAVLIAYVEAQRARTRRHWKLPAGGLFDETAKAQADLF